MPKSTAISPRAKKMWQRLIEWYGTRIIEQYGEAPPPDWVEAVDAVDNDVIRRGLTTIRSKYVAHPPTFPQFAEAIAPAKRANGVKESTVADQLCAYVSRCYGDMLTPKQLRGPWTYIGKTMEGFSEITGVVVDPDGDSQGYRIMVADMVAAAVDWGHPQVPAVESYAEEPEKPRADWLALQIDQAQKRLTQ